MSKKSIAENVAHLVACASTLRTMVIMQTIFHITSGHDWQSALPAGAYTADSLSSEGFIHCSTADQILAVANERYRGQKGLLLLVIAVGRVRPEIRYEDCYETGQQFPHLYGPLNLDAVIQVLPFEPEANGHFQMPQ